MFVPSNHTLFPTSKPLNLVSLIIFSWACFSACWASSLASLMRASRLLMSGMFASLDGWWARGTYPKMSSNGDFFVDAFGQEFRVYCARGSQDAHSFCWLPQYSRRYCSRDWLVLSLCPSVCGWYAEEMFCLILSRSHNSLEKLDANRGSRSDMTFLGSP